MQAASDEEYIQTKTGIPEVDAVLSVLKDNYHGIYRVSLDTGKAERVLMPSYLGYNEVEENFSKLFTSYVSEKAEPDSHRALLSFLNYDVLRQQLREGQVPKIMYKKLSGEPVILSVHRISTDDDSVSDTLWVFAKK